MRLVSSAAPAGLATIAGLLLVLAGCAPEPVVKDSAFIDAETPGVLGFENGDCFLDPADNAALGEERLTATECLGATNQVFAFAALPDGRWAQDRVSAEGTAACGEVFDELWGKADETELDFYAVLPTESTWSDADRDVMCVVYSAEGPFELDPLERR